MVEMDDPHDVLPKPALYCASNAERAPPPAGELTHTKSTLSSTKHGGFLVTRNQSYGEESERLSLSEPYNDTTNHKVQRRERQPAQVILLQTTLRSSQFEKVGKHLHLPVSGHWAVEIRGEVFELNRMETWTWGAPHAFRQDHGAPGGWAAKTSFYLYFSLILYLIKLFVLKPQAASRAQIDTSPLHRYLETREKWTKPSLLGTTTMTQMEIKKTIASRNKHAMFYSIYSNNCQHFILDLCDYIEIRIEGPSTICSIDAEGPADGEMQRDLGTQLPAQSSNIHDLWIKSRLVSLLGNGLHFILGLSPPLVAMIAGRISSNPEIAFPLAAGFSSLFYTLHAWLVWSILILSFEVQPQTLRKTTYMHGSCNTESYMRRLILAHANRNFNVLIRFLLRVEQLPYELFLLVGNVVAVLVAFTPLFLPVFVWYEDATLLMRIAIVWAPCFHLVLMAVLLFLTWNANKGRLRLG